MDCGHGAKLSVLFMKGHKILDVNVGHTVSIGHHELFTFQIRCDALEPSTGKSLFSCFGQRYAPACFGMAVVDFNTTRTESNCEVTVPDFVVEEVIPDDIAFIAKAKYKLHITMMGVAFHDVPENRAPTYLDHGLWFVFGFLAQTRTQPTS